MSNIMFLLPCYPGVGGIEKVTNYFANALCHKHNVIIASQMHIDNQTMLEALNKKVVVLKFPNSIEPLAKENVNFLNNTILQYDIDILIYQDSYSPFFKILTKIDKKFRKNVNIIVAEHNAPMCFWQSMLSDFCNMSSLGLKAALRKILFPVLFILNYYHTCRHHVLAYNLCNSYVLLSEKFKKEFRWLNLFRYKKVKVIGNPLTIECLPISETKSKRMLFVGSLNKRKGVDFLLDIWEKIENSTVDWELMVVGDGEMRQYMDAYIKNKNLKRMRLCGFHADTIPYLQDSKLLLMTSRYEGFGLVLTEAMAYGCIPIAFKSFASVTDIINKDTGVLIKAFDIDKYANTILNLIKDEEKMEIMSKNCILHARNDFSIENITSQWEALININQKM